jgi:ATP-dependent Clp protease ATP-binding subunit ClpA
MPETVSSTVEHIRTELHKVIVGQDDAIEQILIALLAEGHALDRRRARHGENTHSQNPVANHQCRF